MTERIHFGSLEQKELERLKTPQNEAKSAESLSARETIAFSDSTLASAERHRTLVEHIEVQRRARQLALPTNDALVKARLRELGEPICMFGENPPDRRERLRQVMASKGITQGMPSSASAKLKAFHEEATQNEVFYTKGGAELKAARMVIMGDSIRRAKSRVEHYKRLRADEEQYEARELKKQPRTEDEPNTMDVSDEPTEYSNLLANTTALFERFKKYSNVASEVDERTIGSISFSPTRAHYGNNGLLATACWSGAVKLWNVDTCNVFSNQRGHTERVNCVRFNPQPTSASSVSFASSASDNVIHLWSLESETPVSTLKGHGNRVNRIAFHPSGNFLASASHDKTWRLWDLQTKTLLSLQEGHSREIYGVAYHPDGALVGTTGLDSYARVWDTRSGKSIFFMRGHVKPILAIDFAPNGYVIATGSEDHSVRLWDIRKKRYFYILPAHTSLVSQVKFQQHHGSFLVTSSYDRSCKIWSTSDWSLVTTFANHSEKITDVDVTQWGYDDTIIGTTSFDRTWKLWKQDELLL